MASKRGGQQVILYVDKAMDEAWQALLQLDTVKRQLSQPPGNQFKLYGLGTLRSKDIDTRILSALKDQGFGEIESYDSPMGETWVIYKPSQILVISTQGMLEHCPSLKAMEELDLEKEVEGSQPKDVPKVPARPSEGAERRMDMKKPSETVTMTKAEHRHYLTLLQHTTGEPFEDGWSELSKSPTAIIKTNANVVAKFRKELEILKGKRAGPYLVKVVDVDVQGGKGIKPPGDQTPKPVKRAYKPRKPKVPKVEKKSKKPRGPSRKKVFLEAPPVVESVPIQGLNLRQQVIEFLSRDPETQQYRSVEDLDAIAQMLDSMKSALLTIRNAVEPLTVPESVALAEVPASTEVSAES